MREGDSSTDLGTVVAAVRARLESTHPAREALQSTAGAIENAEPELALDDLCHIIRFFGVRITQEEYSILQAVAQEFSMTELLEEAHLDPFVGI
ncbi:hypothetical protein H4W23_00275 [Streptomyces gardneri]|uniref:hypothetical protein n=1 Tax=Streptomyces gardneri TaxID=66892 RepID=UPI0006BC65AD|nr:hypothetical protein [Streptomyces gardneri]QPK43250.1 hypothetical protein H4W23_00275 [Streptomyces gardneri]WRK34461.1 hypothetical protein U0M97_00260 [Streptomyces venezuelae]CUM44169.1 hypothetical protein BN2537_17303 [Streptomyces venezuelae]